MTVVYASKAVAQSEQLPSALAPILVGPYDGSDVFEKSIVWSWFMQPKASDGSEIICDLKIVEIHQGQTAEEALRVNPIIVIKEDLTTSAWQLNFASREFTPGHRYAWRVIAKIRDDGAERVVSESEIWSFTYNTPSSTATEVSPYAESSSLTDQTEEPVPDGKKVLQLNGRTQVTAEASDHTDVLTQAPQSFLRWQIDPNFMLNGVPLGLNLLLSTEKNIASAAINRGSFGATDTRKGINIVLQQRLQDAIDDIEGARDSASIDTLRQFTAQDSLTFANRIAALYDLQDVDLSDNFETLQKLGLATPDQEALSLFPAFGFGAVSPQFSKFLFNNVTLNGALVEFNPGNYYVASAFGKMQRQVDVNGIPADVVQRDSALLTSMEFFRNTYSGRIGFGRRNSNFIVLTALYSEDDDQSLFLQSLLNKPIAFSVDTTIENPDGSFTDTVIVSERANTIVSNQINTVTGIEARYLAEDVPIEFEGEFNISYLNDKQLKLWDSTDPNFGIRSAAGLEKIFNPSENELYDFAASARLAYLLPEKTGKLSAGYRYIGGGYQSTGVAGLRTDVLRTDFLYNHNFFSRQLRVNASYTYEAAGYKQDKFNLSEINAFNGGVDILFKGYPLLQVNFSHNNQDLTLNKNQVELLSEEQNRVQRLLANSSYAYLGLGLRMETFLSYINQRGQTTKDQIIDSTSPGTFFSQTFMLTQRVATSDVLSFGLSGSYTSTVASLTDSTTVGVVDLSALLLITNSFSITGGNNLSVSFIQDNSLLKSYLVFHLNIGDFGDCNLRMDYTSQLGAGGVPATTVNEVTGFRARFITSFKW